MKYIPCLNTSTIQPTDLLTKIDVAQATNFAAIEIWNNDVDGFLSQGGTLAELQEHLSKSTLAVPDVAYVSRWLGCPASDRAKQRAEAERRLAQAQAMGASHIACMPPYEVTPMDQVAADYQELLNIGRDYGVLPAMDFLGFNVFINGIPSAWEVVERCGDPDASLIVDFFHMVRGQTSTLEDLRNLPGEHIAIVHVNDVPFTKPYTEMGDSDRVLPGDGDIPLDDYFEALQETGYSGHISLELFNEDLWAQDPFEVGRIGFGRCERWLG